MKHCIDCKHCIPVKEEPGYSKCDLERSDSFSHDRWIVIGGHEPASQYIHCTTMRNLGRCGLDAKLFEPKNTQPQESHA